MHFSPFLRALVTVMLVFQVIDGAKTLDST